MLHTKNVRVSFNAFLAALLFLLPSHFFLKWEIPQMYVRGLLIDYVLPKLYLTDLVGLGVICLATYLSWPIIRTIKVGKKWALFLLAIMFILTQLGGLFPLTSGIMAIRLVGAAALVWLLWMNRQNVHLVWLRYALLAAIGFQSAVGIFQFVTQQSLVGYWLLGEPTIPTFSGLAQVSWQGALKTLPYGTTAHPNVLGGCLAVYLFLLWRIWQQSNEIFSA